MLIPDPARLSRGWLLAAAVTLLAGVLPAVLWPGDVSWMNDEPALIAAAHYFNQAHELANRGLSGSFPVAYGPFPTQFYQFMLLLTNDLRVIVFVRALLCSAVMALSLLWLARTLRLNPWLAACVVLSPLIWEYERTLWDASFAVPLAALALAAYASFLRTCSGPALLTAVAAVTLVPLIHLQGLPLFGAIAGHLIWRHFRALPRHWIGLLCVVAVITALNGTYVWNTADVVISGARDLVKAGHAAHIPLDHAIFGPLMGGQLFAGDEFVKLMSHLRGPSLLVSTARIISLALVPLVWIGIAWSLWELFSRRLVTACNTNDIDVDSFETTRRSVIAICLATMALQLILFGILRIPPWPQYCFGTFPIHVLFAWMGIEAIGRSGSFLAKWLSRRSAARDRAGMIWQAAAIGIWAIAIGYITLSSMWQIHRQGWDRDAMSPKLSNQIDVARALTRYSDASVMTPVWLYHSYPHAMRGLTLILPPDPAAPRRRSPHGLVIRYRHPQNPRDSEIELIEIHAPSDIPAGSHELDVTPLPRRY